MATGDKVGTIELDERVDKTEEMLCAGISPGRVERALAKEYDVSTRQARRYITLAYERWRDQSRDDAPHRREKVIRMTERFYSKALSERQYTAASSALVLLARLSGAFTQHDPERDKQLTDLGPPPQDPTMALVWAQRCMIFALSEVVNNPSLDPERRLRWIAEIGGKIGMTHAKTLVQSKLDSIADRVLGSGEDHAERLDSTDGLTFPTTSRTRRRDT